MSNKSGITEVTFADIAEEPAINSWASGAQLLIWVMSVTSVPHVTVCAKPRDADNDMTAAATNLSFIFKPLMKMNRI